MEIQWLENIKLFTKWKQFSATVWRVHVPMRRKSHCDLDTEPLYTPPDEALRGRKGGLSAVDPIGGQKQCRYIRRNLSVWNERKLRCVEFLS